MNTRRQTLQGLSLLAAAAAAPGLRAQPRPATLIVSANPGGALDTVARRLAEGLRDALGRMVIVDNKSGAGGQLALVALKQQPADGQTIALMPPSPFTIFPSTYAKLPYDPQQDFVPLGTACSFDFALAVGAGHPARSLEEFGTWCKAHPKQANLALFGLGSTPHFLGWSLAQRLGFELEPVAYKGTAQMAQDTAAGTVACSIASTGNFVELHRGGRLRILATSGPARSALVSEVPSFAELGLAALQIEEWFGFFARSGIAADELGRWSRALQAVLARPELRTALSSMGYAPGDKGGPQLAQAIKDDRQRWAEVVRRTGFKAVE